MGREVFWTAGKTAEREEKWSEPDSGGARL